jgi:predicted transcriptional regulator
MVTAANARRATNAQDLMTLNPISISGRTSVRDAATFLMRRRIGAAPVINDAGWPIGVLSRTDILDAAADALLGTQAPLTVCEVMTPAVYSVHCDTPLAEVCQRMLDLKVHRLFVTDHEGVLVGVISALDVLRHLTAQPDT